MLPARPPVATTVVLQPSSSSMFENLIEILKASSRKIVYTEGTDARILESAARLKKDGFLTPVLVGSPEAVKAAAAKGGFDIAGLEILDPNNYDRFDEMVRKMVELRKGKMTPEECADSLKKSNYFGTMSIEPVAKQLNTRSWYSGAQIRKVTPAKDTVSKRILDTEVTIDTFFNNTTATVEDIAVLKPGDVIVLEHKIGEPVNVTLQNIPKFRASIGTKGSKYAVRIQSIVKGEEGDG